MTKFNSFKIWVENEQVPKTMRNGKIEYFNPQELEQFKRTALKQYFGDRYKGAMSRYDFELEPIRDAYGEVIFSFIITPKGKTRPEILDPSHPNYEYYPGGKTRTRLYKTPKDALAEIPKNPNFAYRGMSWEEWQNIQKTGFILSNNSYNFEGQENLTFFGTDPGTATFYGNGFAPLGQETSIKKPSVVIAVPNQGMLTNKDDKNVPNGELAIKGPASKNLIQNAWILAPSHMKPGRVDLIFNWVANQDGSYSLGKMREGTRFSPNIGYNLKQLI